MTLLFIGMTSVVTDWTEMWSTWRGRGEGPAPHKNTHKEKKLLKVQCNSIMDMDFCKSRHISILRITYFVRARLVSFYAKLAFKLHAKYVRVLESKQPIIPDYRALIHFHDGVVMVRKNLITSRIIIYKSMFLLLLHCYQDRGL